MGSFAVLAVPAIVIAGIVTTALFARPKADDGWGDTIFPAAFGFIGGAITGAVGAVTLGLGLASAPVPALLAGWAITSGAGIATALGVNSFKRLGSVRDLTLQEQSSAAAAHYIATDRQRLSHAEKLAIVRASDTSLDLAIEIVAAQDQEIRANLDLLGNDLIRFGDNGIGEDDDTEQIAAGHWLSLIHI